MESFGRLRSGKSTLVRGFALALFALSAAFVWSLQAPAPAVAQYSGDRVSINQNLTIGPDEVVTGNVSVTNGNLVVDGEVQGNVAVVNGTASVKGRVLGNVAAPVTGSVDLQEGAYVQGDIFANGDVILGPKSEVKGSVRAVGGSVRRDPSARVGGEITAPAPSLGGVENRVFVTPGPRPGTTESSNSAPGWFGGTIDRLLSLLAAGMVSLVLLILAVLVAAIVPRRVLIARQTLEAETGQSVVVGLITAFLFVPVFGLVSVVLAVSIIGWIFMPVLVIATLIALLFGFVVVSAWLGKWVYDAARHAPGQSVSPLMLQVAIGLAILLGTALLPSTVRPGFVTLVLGGMLYLATCVGLGATLLSRFGTLVPPRHRRMSYGAAAVGSRQVTRGSAPDPVARVSGADPPTR